MKMSLLTMLFSFAMLAIAACGSNSNSGSAAAPAATNPYGYYDGSSYYPNSNGYNNAYYTNAGYCFSRANGQQVAMNLCTQGGGVSSGYYMSGNFCYSQTTGQVVSNDLCGGTTSSGTQTGGQCVGTYLYSFGGVLQPVYCNGPNCAGFTMTTVTNHQRVYCQ